MLETGTKTKLPYIKPQMGRTWPPPGHRPRKNKFEIPDRALPGILQAYHAWLAWGTEEALRREMIDEDEASRRRQLLSRLK